MLGLGNTITASNPVEGVALIDPGSWVLYSHDDRPDTRYVTVAGYINNAPAVSATDANTNTPLTTGNRINLANGDSLSVSVTFSRLSGTDLSVQATTTGTAYLYRLTDNSNSNLTVFYLSPLNVTSQTVANLSSDGGNGMFNLTTFGDNNGVTPSVPGGQSSVSNIYRVAITVDQNPPFGSSATITMSSAVFLTTVS